ncbi:MAG: hypothetical protein MJY71_08575, partial [Bacteroidaceae bacterium]|nr:hypothetical protein [Bacteroidaceae bacterium]
NKKRNPYGFLLSGERDSKPAALRLRVKRDTFHTPVAAAQQLPQRGWVASSDLTTKKGTLTDSS